MQDGEKLCCHAKRLHIAELAVLKSEEKPILARNICKRGQGHRDGREVEQARGSRDSEVRGST
jgi:hypothetical protein